MKSTVCVVCAGFAALLMVAAPAVAKDCKSEAISATSREYVSRSLGAFPGSWAAWRKAVKEQAGDGWQAWRRAEDRKIECDQSENAAGNKRWTCTRTARPCRPGSAGTTPVVDDDDRYPPIKDILSRGSRGDQVRTLQYLLRSAGYDVEIDGNFGSGTDKAVRDFQKSEDLKIDGRAGPNTVKALTG